MDIIVQLFYIAFLIFKLLLLIYLTILFISILPIVFGVAFAAGFILAIFK